MKKQKLIFRADGNSQMGMGHIYRSLALVEILAKDFRTCFAIQEPDSQILSLIQQTAEEVISLPGSHDPYHAELHPYLTGAEIVILDGYHFSSEYQKELKLLCKGIVCIDDIPEKHFFSDIIINFCGAVEPSQYDHEIDTQLFLGLDYVFLRSPFRDIKIRTRDFNEAVFLNMGGSDPRNDTSKIVENLLSLNYEAPIEIVIGNNFQFKDQLIKLIQHKANISLHQGLNATKLCEVMRRCCTAILPPSTIALEFLSVGGNIFLHQTASNQACIKKYLLSQNVAHDVEKFKSFYSSKALESGFQKSLQQQQTMLDGKSAERILKIFKALTLACDLEIGKATMSEVEPSFQWANDPDTRKFSYSSKTIPWEDHVRWYEQKIINPDCFYYMFFIDQIAIGQVRFDRSKEEEIDTFVISYTLGREWRGKGLGAYILLKGIKALIQETNVKKIVGYVQTANTNSVNIFKRCGFAPVRGMPIKYAESFKFEHLF